MPSEAGYSELRRLFDYLLAQRIIGPTRAGESAPLDEALNGSGSETSSMTGESRRAAITVIDADDLLQNPEAILKVYCKEVGIDYTPRMLEWGDDDNQEYAAKAFEKWYGFHHDAIESTCLRPRAHGHVSFDPDCFFTVSRAQSTDVLFLISRKRLLRSKKTKSGGKSSVMRRPRSSGRLWMPTPPITTTSSPSRSRSEWMILRILWQSIGLLVTF